PCLQHADKLALNRWAALRWDLDDEPGRLDPTRREHFVPFLVNERAMFRLAPDEERHASNVINAATCVLDQPLHVLEDQLHLSLDVRRRAAGLRVSGRDNR